MCMYIRLPNKILFVLFNIGLKSRFAHKMDRHRRHECRKPERCRVGGKRWIVEAGESYQDAMG